MKISKEVISNNARGLFITNGFKDTNIAGITAASGVAVGTFYNYYSSKEILFLELLFQESTILKRSIIQQVDLEGDMTEVFKQVASLLFAGMKKNPILREWFNPDVYAKLQRHLPNYYQEQDFLYDLFRDLINRWQRKGWLRDDIDADLFLAMINSLSFVDMHKEDFGVQYFPMLIDNMLELIIKGVRK